MCTCVHVLDKILGWYVSGQLFCEQSPQKRNSVLGSWLGHYYSLGKKKLVALRKTRTELFSSNV